MASNQETSLKRDFGFSKKTLIVAMALATMVTAGCSGVKMPSTDDYERPTNKTIMDENVDQRWLQEPPMTVRKSNVGTYIDSPNGLPWSVQQKDVTIEMDKPAKMQDFMVALSSSLDMPTLVSDEEVSDTSIFVPNYKGKLGPLLASIAKTKDITFSWYEGVLVLSKNSQYVVSLPQDEDLLESVAGEIESIGASDVQTSVNAGLISYSASPKNQTRISKYLERLSVNSALITLQVMVINVNFDREKREGFDWGSFQMKLGDLALSDQGGGVPTPDENQQPGIDPGVGDGEDNEDNPSDGEDGGDNGDDGDNSGDDGSGGDAAKKLTQGTLASLSGNALGFKVLRKSVDIAGLFNLLSTYGNAKTTQDTSLKTISGKEVALKSGQSIPYVSNLSVQTTGSSYGGGALGGVQTSTADTGIDLTMKPYFEADSELVSVELELSLKSVLGFVKLSAGNQVGSLSQPNTQEQSFDSTVRVPVGDTVILGGVTYESLSDNRTTLSPFENADIASKEQKITNNSVFILLRPTVTVYRSNDAKKGG